MTIQRWTHRKTCLYLGRATALQATCIVSEKIKLYIDKCLYDCMYVCVYTDICMYVCVHVNRYTTFTHVCRCVSVDVYRYTWLMPMRQAFK